MKSIGDIEIENPKKLRSGKVREMFFNSEILIITTDRI